jgi:hypothetical protein
MKVKRLCCVLNPANHCSQCMDQVCNECYWIMGKTQVMSKMDSDGVHIWEQRYLCDDCHGS